MENCVVIGLNALIDVFCARPFEGLCNIDVSQQYFLRGLSPFDQFFSWTGNTSEVFLGFQNSFLERNEMMLRKVGDEKTFAKVTDFGTSIFGLQTWLLSQNSKESNIKLHFSACDSESFNCNNGTW